MMATNPATPQSPSPLPMIAGVMAIITAVLHLFQGARELFNAFAYDEARFIVTTLIFNSFAWIMSFLGILAGVWLMQGKASGWLIIASMRVSFGIAWAYIIMTVGNPLDGVSLNLIELLIFVVPWISGFILLVLMFLPGTMQMIDKKAVFVLISIVLGGVIYGFTQFIQGAAMTFNHF